MTFEIVSILFVLFLFCLVLGSSVVIMLDALKNVADKRAMKRDSAKQE